MTELNRRALLAAGAATALASAFNARAQTARSAAAAGAPLRQPVARLTPVRETLHGVETLDGYRWMETPSDPEWEPFMRGQAAYTRRVLDALPAAPSC